LAEKFDIIYDGWGTYYEHPDDFDDDDDLDDFDDE
jgi:regulator of RNase E activity RraB